MTTTPTVPRQTLVILSWDLGVPSLEQMNRDLVAQNEALLDEVRELRQSRSGEPISE